MFALWLIKIREGGLAGRAIFSEWALGKGEGGVSF